MPSLGGIDVLRAIRGDERLRAPPVVMLTSSLEESDHIESYQLGVNAYVVKPVGFDDFVSAVKQLGLFWAVLNKTPLGQSRDA